MVMAGVDLLVAEPVLRPRAIQRESIVTAAHSSPGCKYARMLVLLIVVLLLLPILARCVFARGYTYSCERVDSALVRKYKVMCILY